MDDAIRLVAHRARRGVRPDRKCLGCFKTAPASSGEITRHHLVPRADRAAQKTGHVKTIPLCITCHKMVHDVWGDGHKFIGPTTKDPLVAWLRTRQVIIQAREVLETTRKRHRKVVLIVRVLAFINVILFLVFFLLAISKS